MSGWIGVDLDGTLAHYEPGQFNSQEIGQPIAPMVERVKKWIMEGKEVRIFTARVCYGDPHNCRAVIEEWCWRNIGWRLKVTNEKDYSMEELWDDRAVQVEHNTGRRMVNL